MQTICRAAATWVLASGFRVPNFLYWTTKFFIIILSRMKTLLEQSLWYLITIFWVTLLLLSDFDSSVIEVTAATISDYDRGGKRNMKSKKKRGGKGKGKGKGEKISYYQAANNILIVTPCFQNPGGCLPPYHYIPGYSGGQYPNTAQPEYGGGQYPNTAQPEYGGGQYPNTVQPEYGGGQYPNAAQPGYGGGQYPVPSPQQYGGGQYPIYGQNVYSAQPGYVAQYPTSTSQGYYGGQYPYAIPPGYGVGQYSTMAPMKTLQPAYRPPGTLAVSQSPPLSYYTPPNADESYLKDCLPDCPRPPREWEVISVD